MSASGRASATATDRLRPLAMVANGRSADRELLIASPCGPASTAIRLPVLSVNSVSGRVSFDGCSVQSGGITGALRGHDLNS